MYLTGAHLQLSAEPCVENYIAEEMREITGVIGRQMPSEGADSY
jgi:hypothetical protein